MDILDINISIQELENKLVSIGITAEQMEEMISDIEDGNLQMTQRKKET